MIWEVSKIEQATRAILSEIQCQSTPEQRRSVAAFCDSIMQQCAQLRKDVKPAPLLDWEGLNAASCDDRR